MTEHWQNELVIWVGLSDKLFIMSALNQASYGWKVPHTRKPICTPTCQLTQIYFYAPKRESAYWALFFFFCNIIMLQLPPQTQGHWYQGKPHGIVPSFRWVICALWKALSGLTVSVSRPSEPVGMPSTPHPMQPQNKILCDFDFAEGPDNLYHIRLNILAQLTIE